MDQESSVEIIQIDWLQHPCFPGRNGRLNIFTPRAIDWLILTELTYVATAYWLTLLTAVSAGRGIKSVIPTEVFSTFHRLGLAGIAITLLAVALLLAVGTTMSFAAAKIHAAEAVGILLLGLCCVCGPLLLTFVLRRLGEEYYRTAALKEAPQPGNASNTVAPAR